MNDCQEDRQMARATARVARTIHGDVEHGQVGIVRATLAVALAIIHRPSSVELAERVSIHSRLLLSLLYT